MLDVTVEDLRNHGDELVRRAQRGERLRITRAGRPLAELTGLSPAPVPLHVLRRRRANLPHVGPAALRTDIDAVIDVTI